jgi:hypothetical protein
MKRLLFCLMPNRARRRTGPIQSYEWHQQTELREKDDKGFLREGIMKSWGGPEKLFFFESILFSSTQRAMGSGCVSLVYASCNHRGYNDFA